MGAFVRDGDVDGYGRANLAFHGRLYDGAHNSYLTELAAATRRRLAPFRSAQLEAADRLQKSYEEHGTIVTAILRGDGARAATAIRQHLEITEQTWLELGHGAAAAAPAQAVTSAFSEITA
jgi:DNA-binding GntR family transcriptional regulator